MTDFVMDSQTPKGSLESRWTQHKFNLNIVSPANRKKYTVIIVGTGLAGSAAAASLGEMGYNVKTFCFQDSPRRAHSIAAQGGINGAKNYQNDGDSAWRLFYDTIKGGDYRARESNVFRLAELSNAIIDQAVAQGVPFAREYSGYLANRSFGGAQVSRTFYARGQTGQQLLLGAYQAMNKEIAAGSVTHRSRCEMQDVIMVNGQAKGIVTRDLVTGELESHMADCVVLCTGGYGNVFYLSTNAKGCNASAVWRAHKKGALFANPCFTQIHPTCIPQQGSLQSKLTLMSESLRNDGRVWAPSKAEDCDKNPEDIAEYDRDYFLERMYPAFGNLVPRDIASRAVKLICDEGRGVGHEIEGKKLGVYLDFAKAISEQGQDAINEKYGNLFEMYQRITNEDPNDVPMRIYPAVHYTMGGLWVDYNLMTSVDGLFAAGEANFSDHGTAFDKIIQAGGYIATRTGSASEANTIAIAKDQADDAFDSATCIGCGACVAVCPNASATLFVAAKVSHLSSLPQGEIDSQRAKTMLNEMDKQGFGTCSNYRECERACPKEISVLNITKMNKLLYQNN
ncbi:UNVERIFIED_CONTAM: hypothetical protein GTU68_023556 [Idotea baltica]|nr:hypothetical protein [Idotea baltica]